MKNFALTGVAGYIAPRHLRAIHDTGNRLVAAMDPHDSVGILDRYFRDAAFFTEFERFDRHLEKLRRDEGDESVDYVSICSPNHLHDAHIRLALRIGAHALCEKPLVLNPWNLDVLEDLEREYDRTVNTVLQLRVHPRILELRERLASGAGDSAASRDGKNAGKRHSVRLTYVTTRGTWYRYSWKGDEEKSGGIATNIGIHFFDLLIWLFGGARSSTVHIRDAERMAGTIDLENADVEWFLSLDPTDLPGEAADAGQPTYRSITVDGEEVEFSGGFENLHTRVYEETLAGNGFRIPDARPSIELVHSIRTAPVAASTGERHPMA